MIDTEILLALDELKSEEGQRCDGIPAELLKSLGEKGKNWQVEVCKTRSIRGWKIAGRFFNSDYKYNREEDQCYRICRP